MYVHVPAPGLNCHAAVIVSVKTGIHPEGIPDTTSVIYCEPSKIDGTALIPKLIPVSSKPKASLAVNCGVGLTPEGATNKGILCSGTLGPSNCNAVGPMGPSSFNCAKLTLETELPKFAPVLTKAPAGSPAGGGAAAAAAPPPPATPAAALRLSEISLVFRTSRVVVECST